MSSSIKLLFVLGLAGLVAACAAPLPPEPEPMVVPIVVDDPVMSKY